MIVLRDTAAHAAPVHEVAVDLPGSCTPRTKTEGTWKVGFRTMARRAHKTQRGREWLGETTPRTLFILFMVKHVLCHVMGVE